MKPLKYFFCILLAATLFACGGVSNTPADDISSTNGVSTIEIALSGGGNSVSASGVTAVVATLKDASGVAMVGKAVTFTGDATLIKFNPSSGKVLTGSDGVATIQISPVSLTSAGASTLTAAAQVKTVDVSATFDFQLANANLGLKDLNLGTGALAAFGNRPISVTATVNGSAATAVPVQVTFSANCGTVNPATVASVSTGVASTTYTASAASCAGTNVTVTAAAAGAISVSGAIAVSNSVASNVLFVSTTPQLIYLKDSVGPRQAQVAFKVVDSGGNPLQNKTLKFSLSNSSTGIALVSPGNTIPVVLTTDSAGTATVAVFSGTVPTSLNVKATLLDGGVETTIFSESNSLTVATGRPVQKSMSLALEKLSIEGMTRDGVTTQVTLSMADRQGNPVPPGTKVNFVSETGVLQPAFCVIPDVTPPQSSCTVEFRSQGTRTANGAVSILAYVEGDEDFVDNNGNNIYDAGEPFTDLGRATRDDNGKVITGADGVFNSGEYQVPRAFVAACVDASGCAGDATWGAADVRAQTTLVQASGDALIRLPKGSVVSSSGFSVIVSNYNSSLVADLNNFSVPTGSSIEVKAVAVVTKALTTCKLNSLSSIVVPNTTWALTVPIALSGCNPTDVVSIKVTTPLGTVSQTDFVLP